MKPIRLLATTILVLGVAGCASVDTASRNAPLDVPALGGQSGVSASYTVMDVRALVPDSLRVSESNGYYPVTDIVWRGDLAGDRHRQLEAIFETAAARGAETLKGAVPVIVDVELQRFHGVTERTRYSVGGVYNIVFRMTVRDAASGAIIEGPRVVEANLAAPGGQAAVALDQAGQTEKVRVTDFLTNVLLQQLGGAPIGTTGA
jgi:hypothetical protein